MSACSELCGFCGRCSASWERGTRTPAAPKLTRCEECGVELLPMDMLAHVLNTGHISSKPREVARTA